MVQGPFDLPSPSTHGHAIHRTTRNSKETLDLSNPVKASRIPPCRATAPSARKRDRGVGSALRRDWSTRNRIQRWRLKLRAKYPSAVSDGIRDVGSRGPCIVNRPIEGPFKVSGGYATELGDAVGWICKVLKAAYSVGVGPLVLGGGLGQRLACKHHRRRHDCRQGKNQSDASHKRELLNCVLYLLSTWPLYVRVGRVSVACPHSFRGWDC